MDETQAKHIGSKQGIISVGIGLLVAQFIMASMISSDNGFIKAFFWFTDVDYKLNILVGAIAMLFCGHFYGKIAGKLILLKKWNFIVVGFLTGMAVLLSTAFLSGWLGFFQEGLDNFGGLGNPFFDYIFKPLYWISLFGIIPSLVVGVWFGWRIKRKGKTLEK